VAQHLRAWIAYGNRDAKISNRFQLKLEGLLACGDTDLFVAPEALNGLL
jgi:hypothetical protein